jgi:hypothetical protein
MRTKKMTIILLAALVFIFASAQGAFAQEAVNDGFGDEIEAVNIAAEEDPSSLLVKLSLEFDVDLVLLQEMSAQGYAPGEIWLALEISSSSEITFQDALVLTDGPEGHGWGVFAQTLGIAPGSDDFHALKLKWGEHQGALVRAMKQEREKQSREIQKGKTENGANEKSGGSSAGNSDSNKKGGKN